MAQAARRKAGTDFGVGITGVAGPDPEDGIPPGTVHVAVATPEGEHVLSMTMNHGRAAVKRRAVTTGLLLLRRELMGEAK